MLPLHTILTLQFTLIEDTWEFNNKLILDYDFDAYSPLVVVHENLSSKLKEHQVSKIKMRLSHI